MRILITGCHGLIGQRLIEGLRTEEHEIHGVDLQRQNYFEGLQHYTYHQGDVSDRQRMLDLIRDTRPRAVVNLAAMTRLDACEVQRERCWEVNARALEHLVDGARRVGARLVQLSTDHVFDGEAGPYSELDRPNPVSYYGKSKHAAENTVLGGGIAAAVLRTVMVIGHGRHLPPRFVGWLVGKLREGTEVKVVTDQISNVTHVDDVALAIRRAITLKKTGVYHVAGREIISRYDFALRIAEAYNLDPAHLQPTLTRLMGKTAPRPLQHGLVVDKAQKELNLTFANVEEALKRYREREATFN